MSPLFTGTPQELDLRVGSPLHTKIKEAVRRRFEQSARLMSQRYDRWNESDAFLRGYVDFTKQASKDSTRDDGKEYPYARSIVIPYSYAVLQIYLTYLMAVFMARDPIFPIQGYGPEDVLGAEAMEHVLGYQMDHEDGALALYSLFQDAMRYSFGVTKCVWEVQESEVERRRPVPFPMSLMLGPTQTVTERVVGYAGNTLVSVDPFRFYPDPRMPFGQIEHAEYLGHTVWRSYNYIRQKAAEGIYLEENVQQLPRRPDLLRAHASEMGDRSRRDEFVGVSPELGEVADDLDRGPVKIDELSIHLVPNDWQLGPRTSPQVWFLTLGNEETVIRARPAVYNHGRLPYVTASFGFDPHAYFTQSLPELMDGLQTHITWLYNSHMENVRKGMNIQGIYDPSMIHTEDLENPQAGKWVRIKEDYQGVPGAVDRSWKQLAFQDVTAGHFKDIRNIHDMIQRITAASDPQGGQETDTRRTATEVQNILQQSGRRLQLVAFLLGAQAVRPLGRMMLANTQQLLQEPIWTRILGHASPRLLQRAQGQLIQVSPEDIQGRFDMRVLDASLPPDPSRFAEVWKELFMGLSANANLIQAFAAEGVKIKMTELFKKTVEVMGIKNVEDFFESLPPPQVMANAQVAAGVQAGNLAPIGAGTNGAQAGTVTPVGVNLQPPVVA